MKKIIVMLLGVFFQGIGVSLLNISEGGPDPFSALNYVVSDKLNMSFGTYQLILNIILLIFVFIKNRRLLGLGTSPYDAISFFVHGYVEKIAGRKIAFRLVRICYDGLFALLGWLIGGNIGIVTVLMVVLLGPSVDIFANIMKRFRM